jgi:hypothetical protein
MYEKLEKLINILHGRTMSGTVHWEETSDPGRFQTAFPGSTITIFTRQSREFMDELDYALQIINDNGNLIEQVADTDFDDKAHGFLIMKEMYEAARRIALGTEQTIDDLLSSLGGTDDDTPF